MYSLLVLNLLMPFIMLWVGYTLKKHPITDMDSNNGYNTPTSRKSQAHWDYAQSIAPDNFIRLGKILGIVEIILNILLFILKIPAHSSVIAGTVIGFIFLFWAFIKTEYKIKDKFEQI